MRRALWMLCAFGLSMPAQGQTRTDLQIIVGHSLGVADTMSLQDAINQWNDELASCLNDSSPFEVSFRLLVDPRGSVVSVAYERSPEDQVDAPVELEARTDEHRRVIRCYTRKLHEQRLSESSGHVSVWILIRSSRDLFRHRMQQVLQPPATPAPTRPSSTRASVQLRTPAIRGPLTVTQVSSTLRQSSDSLRQCALTVASRQRGRQVQVMLDTHFEINAAGRVGQARINASPTDPTITGCVGVALRSLQFPSSSGVTVVDYPIQLSARVN